MEKETQTPHKRRVRYKGKYPKKFEEKYKELNFVPVIGDVRSPDRVDYVFRNWHPQVVFHAAAYKHVPMMEDNPCESVGNNVDGTRVIADLAVKYGTRC